MTPEQRFWAKVDKSTDCWLWTACVVRGYGAVKGIGSSRRAHRVSWELANGRPVPAGLEIDHLCRTPLCVRPDHLEAVTRRENVIRGMSPPANNARKTACLRGHLFTPENTKWRGTSRLCRMCLRQAKREARMRQAA
jgi:hypothetical protein